MPADEELGPDEVICALLDQSEKQAQENRDQAKKIITLERQIQYLQMAHKRSKGDLGKRIRELQEEIKKRQRGEEIATEQES